MASLRDHLQGGRSAGPQRRGPSNTNLILLAVLLISLIIIGGVLNWKGKAVFVPTNAATLCPTDRPPTELIVFLLDMSDAYTEAQQLEINNQLSRAKQRVGRFGRIEIYAVDRTGQRVTSPVLQLCNPGSDREVNAIYQNPSFAREKWTVFSQRLEEELKRLMQTEESATSPIFEAIQSTALRTFNRAEYDGLPRRLVIVSDLLQHVPGRLSQYQSLESFSEFRGWDYFADIRADLSGVDVTILYLVRPETPQRPEHLMFWEQFFVAQGASVGEVVPIYGAR